jgi:hypothetical protein
MFFRMTKTIRPEAQKYHTDEDQLLQFDKHLEEIEGQLFYGLIFQNCIEQDFDCADVVTVQKNELFSEEFFLNIKSIYNRLVTPRGTLPLFLLSSLLFLFTSLSFVSYLTWVTQESSTRFFIDNSIWVFVLSMFSTRDFTILQSQI